MTPSTCPPERRPLTPERVETIKHVTEVWHRVHVVARDLVTRANRHDAGKLQPPETDAFEASAMTLHALDYTSPAYQKDSLTRLSAALSHHYAANDHHPQFHVGGIQGMSLIHLLEMVCDWHAAVKRNDTGDIRESIEFNRTRFGYGDELARILHNTVDHLEQLMGSTRAAP